MYEFDFISFRRPDADVEPMNDEDFQSVRVALNQAILSESKKGEAGFVDEDGDQYNDLAVENAVYYVRWRLPGMWLDTNQIAQLLALFPVGSKGRQELFILTLTLTPPMGHTTTPPLFNYRPLIYYLSVFSTKFFNPIHQFE